MHDCRGKLKIVIMAKKNKANRKLRLESQQAKPIQAVRPVSTLAVSHVCPWLTGMQVKGTQNLLKAVTGKVVTALFPQLPIKVIHMYKMTHCSLLVKWIFKKISIYNICL